MKIALIANPVKDTDFCCAKKTAAFLLSKNAEVYTDKKGISDKVKVLPTEECISLCDVIITVGGDGTILHIAAEAATKDKPLLGINLGKVGYMAEIEPNETELLERIFTKNYHTEKRMMISFEVRRGGKTVYASEALNDVVLSRGHLPRLSEMQLSESGKFICNYVADGVIFSTPTGSTAYTLSAGGPIIDLGLDCIIATPICAHALSQSRSIAFRPEAELCVKLLTDNEAYLTSDGGGNILLCKNDDIIVRKSDISLTLIKLKNQSFYEKLSCKLK